MTTDRVSDERLRALADKHYGAEAEAAIRELLAIRTEAARGREEPREWAQRVRAEWLKPGHTEDLYDHFAAAIQRDREVGAAAAVALRAERDALREALTRWVAVFDGDDEVLSPADLDLARAVLNPPTAGALETK